MPSSSSISRKIAASLLALLSSKALVSQIASGAACPADGLIRLSRWRSLSS
jgi:hypothetical protein